jgi:hypothetical protein
MTDFLTDLLERSRGQGAGLAPRIPSVFEPARGDTPWLAGDDTLQPAAEETFRLAPDDTLRLAAEAQAAAERMPAARRPQPSPQAAASQEGQIPAPSREVPTPTAARVPARTEGGEIGRRPAGEPAIPQAGTAVPQAAAAAETARELLAEVAVPRPEPAGHRSRAAGRLAAAVSRGGDQRVPLPETEPETTERPRRGALPPPAARVGEPLPPPRPGLLTVPPPGAFAAPPVLPGPVGDPAPPPEPTVHVTIGRVEVRAVTAPARPPRAAPAARTMSLDEYLAERNQRRQA